MNATPAPAVANAGGVLTSAGPGGAWAWVALDVEPRLETESGFGSDAERRTDAAMADAAWLAGQWDPTSGTRLELRYLHKPDSGRVRCVVLGRVHGPDVTTVTAAAIRLRDRLAALPPHMRTSPVTSMTDIHQLLTPFAAHQAGLVEIRKQIRSAQPARPDAGVVRYLAVTRFAAGAASWDPLWQTIANLPYPVMLTVGLEPYAVPSQFVDMLADLAARYGRLATPAQAQHGILHGHSQLLAPDPFAAYAAWLYSEAHRHYREAVFRTRITLASPVPPRRSAHPVVTAT